MATTATLIYNEDLNNQNAREGCATAVFDADISLADLLVRSGIGQNSQEDVFLVCDDGEDIVGLDDEFSPKEGDITLVLRRRTS